MKLTPAASTLMSASPGLSAGSETSSYSRTSGPPTAWTRIAFTNETAIIGYARPMSDRPRRVIVGMTGATGTIVAVRALQMLRDAGVETHLVMSRWAVRTLLHETPYRP